MAVKRGLGKGLGALFSDYEYDLDAEIQESGSGVPVAVTGEPLHLNIGDVYANVNQPRKQFDEETIRELSASIKAHGVISPIIVTKRADGYMIVAGERRWRAAKLAGLAQIPAIVKDFTEKEVMEISLIENLQREDLNAIDAARAIKELMDVYHYTQESVADRLGKKRPTITNTLRLLTLAPDVISLVKENRLSAGHARCLIPIGDPAVQAKFAAAACDNKVAVRDLEKAVRNYLSPKAPKKPDDQCAELRELVEYMQRAFATKVSVYGNEKKGRIFIDYYTTDDLDRIHALVKQFAPKDNNMIS
ncbi:MAG: ParB/RepB/Spo0J family partition protein [Firmicutes bacterium]|nr:ParB/RepB/Spo0J family partition protein [Bacillota bacterium]